MKNLKQIKEEVLKRRTKAIATLEFIPEKEIEILSLIELEEFVTFVEKINNHFKDDKELIEARIIIREMTNEFAAIKIPAQKLSMLLGIMFLMNQYGRATLKQSDSSQTVSYHFAYLMKNR